MGYGGTCLQVLFQFEMGASLAISNGLNPMRTVVKLSFNHILMVEEWIFINNKNQK